MTAGRLAFLYTAVAATILGAQSTPSQTPTANAGVRDVIDAAHAAAPEFTADVLITLVESGLVRDPRLQRKLLDDAGSIAGYAQEPLQLDRDDGGALGRAFRDLFRKGIDRASLQARVARDLLSLDPKAARERFEAIDVSANAQYTCEQPYYYRPTVYYSALLRILQSIPEGAERVRAIQGHLTRFHSPAQVVPLADTLWQMAPGLREDLPTVVYTFAAELPKLTPDSRIFSSGFRSMFASIKRLAGVCPAPVREYLVQQTRAWVLQASSHRVCTELPYRVMAQDGKISKVNPVHPADLFNEEIAPLVSSKPVIEPGDLSTGQPGPSYNSQPYSADLLRFDRIRVLLTEEDGATKSTARWKSEMENYITMLLQWKNPSPDDSDPTIYYLEKALLLQDLMGIPMEPVHRGKMSSDEFWEARHKAPRADVTGRLRVMMELVDWYESGTAAAVYSKRRLLWFSPVRDMLSSPDNTPEFDDLLIRSKDPVLHVYGLLAKLEVANGRSYF